MISRKGEFARGKRHGQGTYTYPNGDAYTGRWANDLKNGQGVYTYAQMDVQKEGEWVDGQLQGQSVIQYPDHVLLASFTGSDRFEAPVKFTFKSTGYETVVKDLTLVEQTVVAVPVEN